MGKKKGNSNRPHPTKSFDQYVADATLQKFRGYIDHNLQSIGRALMERQAQQLSGLITRLIAIEEILMEKYPEVTKEALAVRIASVEDRLLGFEEVTEGGVVLGDRVRVEIKTKKSDEDKWSEGRRLCIDGVGTGKSLPAEIEEALLGTPKDETKTVLFGKDHSLEASITVNKISRKPKPEQPEQSQTEEVNESANAG